MPQQMPWCCTAVLPSHLGSEQADEAQARAKLARRSTCRNTGHVCGHVLCQQVRRRPQHLARQVIVSCARQTAVSLSMKFCCALWLPGSEGLRQRSACSVALTRV